MEIRLGDIASRFDLEVSGDPNVLITGIAALGDATDHQLGFLFNSRYREQLDNSEAGAVVLSPEDRHLTERPCLISPQPRLSWAQIAGLFDPVPVPEAGVHPSAVVADDAQLGDGVSIAANVVVEPGAILGAGCIIGPGCVVGASSAIGERSRLYANVSIYHNVTIGADCIVHSGAVIGADGFGFEFDGVGLTKIPQVYGVVIGDRVEIGALTSIDRGALNDTVLGEGVKLDDQVHIGHGTTVGANTVMSGKVGVSGSTKIGSYCLIGGAVGIADNIEVTDQVELTGMTFVNTSIAEKGRYSSGTTAQKSAQWKRSIVGFRQLGSILQRLRKLERGRD